VADWRGTRCSTRAVQKCCDPLEAISWACISELADRGQQFCGALPLIAPTAFAYPKELLGEMRPGGAERVGYNFYLEASRGDDGNF
jgi:hypothetical protein